MSDLQKHENTSVQTSSGVDRREWLRTGSMGMAAMFGSALMTSSAKADHKTLEGSNFVRSIRDFGVLPSNPPDTNHTLLQEAIDWASNSGAAIFVEPSEDPYPVTSGLILRKNSSLIGVHGPTPRGTRHPKKTQPVGSVFKIEDEHKPFLTVEAATQLR